ncbi:MAG: carboxypeptidase-like regulatory domain-containing protein [Bacteroidetes bacterium]|nr:carboxypeptidase-like regulatory domain-containing protein [Bacteroidota bacterium]
MILKQVYRSKEHGLAMFIIFLLLHASVAAQTAMDISGKVADAENGSPLLFAQIALSNSTTGTVTNEDGQFFLGIPENHLHDTIVISYLGYETARMPVAGLIGKTSLIWLKSKEFNLREVEVTALTPEEVLRRAFMRIPENYGRDSILLTAFYRSQKFAGKKLAEYTEAVIEDLKAGYFHQNTMKEIQEAYSRSNYTHLVKGRVVSDTALVNSMGDFGKTAGCLGCIFMKDMVEFSYHTILDEETFRTYSLKMEELGRPGGGRIYHIWFDQSKKNQRGYKGELFIDGNSFAVMKIKRSISYMAFYKYEKEKYRKTYTINDIPGWIAEMPLIDQTLNYSNRENGWYLSSIRDEEWIIFTLPSTGQKVRMGYKNDLVITNVTRDPLQVRSFSGDKKAGLRQRWDQLAGQADEAFWANYNYLPVEEKLKQDIKGIGSYEK